MIDTNLTVRELAYEVVLRDLRKERAALNEKLRDLERKMAEVERKLGIEAVLVAEYGR